MEAAENIFNLFYYSTLNVIKEVGIVRHSVSGTDAEKIAFLKNHVNNDFLNAKKFELPDGFQIKMNDTIRNGIDFTSYRDLTNQGHGLLIFEKALTSLNAPSNPLVIITPVKDGKVFIEGIADLYSNPDNSLRHVTVDKQDEWYSGYIDENGFHFAELINDDFISAVRLLYNARHLVSAMKLLMITVDTVSYLEYGDSPKNFQLWLAAYVPLSSIDITEDELWEFRNSILHMTNLDSRKVQAQKVKRILFYDAHPSTNYVSESDEGKYFKFMDLLKVLAEGISKWGESYNIQKDKFKDFLQRYDRIISDKRMTTLNYVRKS